MSDRRSDDPQGETKTPLAPATGAAVGMGGAVTAAAVSACCAGPALGPLLISLLGVGPTVALEALRPYSVPLIVGSGVLIGSSFWLNARQPNGSRDRRSIVVRTVSRIVTWGSAIVWLGTAVMVMWARLAH